MEEVYGSNEISKTERKKQKSSYIPQNGTTNTSTTTTSVTTSTL